MNVIMLDRSTVGAFTAYQAGRGLSPQTIKRRRISLAQWTTYCTDPFDVDGHTIEGWLAQLSSPATRKAYLADLRAFYRWAIRSGRTERDPTVMVDTPRVPTRLPTPLTATDVHLAIDTAAGDLRLMVMLGAFAGLRVSEIAALRGEDVTPPVLLVRQGKGAKDRAVPLHPRLEVLAGRCGPLFPGMSGNAVSQRIRSHFRRLGIDRRPHDLRASFATEAARVSNGNQVLVAQLLGHASPQTTQRYMGWAAPGAEVVARLFAAA